MELKEARCFLCMLPVTPGQLYLVVYMASPEHPSIAATQNRAGVVHLGHLQNIFRPDMIATRIVDMPFAGPGAQRIEIQVSL